MIDMYIPSEVAKHPTKDGVSQVSIRRMGMLSMSSIGIAQS